MVSQTVDPFLLFAMCIVDAYYIAYYILKCYQEIKEIKERYPSEEIKDEKNEKEEKVKMIKLKVEERFCIKSDEFIPNRTIFYDNKLKQKLSLKKIIEILNITYFISSKKYVRYYFHENKQCTYSNDFIVSIKDYKGKNHHALTKEQIAEILNDYDNMKKQFNNIISKNSKPKKYYCLTCKRISIIKHNPLEPMNVHKCLFCDTKLIKLKKIK